MAPQVGLEPTTPSVRNIVALLACGAAHCSLFLPAQRLPPPATGSGSQQSLGQKHSRTACLQRCALLVVSSCSKASSSCHRQRKPLSQLTADAAVTQDRCAEHNLKTKKTGTTEAVPVFFGSPSWTRTNDPAVNSRMLYRLSY